MPDTDVTINRPETPQELRDEEEALQAHLDIMRGEEPADATA